MYIPCLLQLIVLLCVVFAYCSSAILLFNYVVLYYYVVCIAVFLCACVCVILVFLFHCLKQSLVIVLYWVCLCLVWFVLYILMFSICFSCSSFSLLFPLFVSVFLVYEQRHYMCTQKHKHCYVVMYSKYWVMCCDFVSLFYCCLCTLCLGVFSWWMCLVHACFLISFQVIIWFGNRT